MYGSAVGRRIGRVEPVLHISCYRSVLLGCCHDIPMAREGPLRPDVRGLSHGVRGGQPDTPMTRLVHAFVIALYVTAAVESVALLAILL